MEDYDPACPTEDDYAMPEIDLSQVPLPPPPPSQTKGSSRAASSSSSQPAATTPLQDPEEDSGRRGRKKKKKKKKGQTRRSAADDYDEEYEDDHNRTDDNTEGDHKRAELESKPDDKLETNTEENASAETEVTTDLPKSESTQLKPLATPSTPKQLSATSTKLQFKLKTDPDSGKAKVSFNLGKSLRRGIVPVKSTADKKEDTEVNEDKAEDDGSNEEDVEGGEVLAPRFKVAKKFEMFRPDMLMKKQPITVQLPPTAVAAVSETAEVVVNPVSKSKVINPASAAAAAAINAAIAATETAIGGEEVDDVKKVDLDEARNIEMDTDGDKDVRKGEGKEEFADSSDIIEDKKEKGNDADSGNDKSESRKERNAEDKTKKSRSNSRERSDSKTDRESRNERTRRREDKDEEDRRERERGDRYSRRREGRDSYSYDRRTRSSRRSRSRSRSPYYTSSLRRSERGGGNRSGDYDSRRRDTGRDKERRGRETTDEQRARSRSKERLDERVKDRRRSRSNEDRETGKKIEMDRERDRTEKEERKVRRKADGDDREKRKEDEKDRDVGRLTEKERRKEEDMDRKSRRSNESGDESDKESANDEQRVRLRVDMDKEGGEDKEDKKIVKDNEEKIESKKVRNNKETDDVEIQNQKNRKNEDESESSTEEYPTFLVKAKEAAKRRNKSDPDIEKTKEKSNITMGSRSRVLSQIDSQERNEKEGITRDDRKDKCKIHSRDSSKDRSVSPRNMRKDRQEHSKDRSISPRNRRKDRQVHSKDRSISPRNRRKDRQEHSKDRSISPRNRRKDRQEHSKDRSISPRNRSKGKQEHSKDRSISPRNRRKDRQEHSKDRSISPRNRRKDRHEHSKDRSISPRNRSKGKQEHSKDRSISPRNRRKDRQEHSKDRSISPRNKRKGKQESAKREDKQEHSKDRSKSPRNKRKAMEDSSKDQSISPSINRKDRKSARKESPEDKADSMSSRQSRNDSIDKQSEVDNERQGRRWHRQRWSESPERSRQEMNRSKSDKGRSKEDSKKAANIEEESSSISLGQVFLDLSAIPEKSKWEVDEDEEERDPTRVVEDVDELPDREFPRRFPPQRPLMSARDMERMQGYQHSRLSSSARRDRTSRWSKADAEPREFRDRRSVVEEERKARNKKSDKLSLEDKDRDRGKDDTKEEIESVKIVGTKKEEMKNEKEIKSTKKKSKKTGSRLSSMESSPSLAVTELSNEKTIDSADENGEGSKDVKSITSEREADIDAEKESSNHSKDIDIKMIEKDADRNSQDSRKSKSPTGRKDKKKKGKKKSKKKEKRSESSSREGTDTDSSNDVLDRQPSKSSPVRKDKTKPSSKAMVREDSRDSRDRSESQIPERGRDSGKNSRLGDKDCGDDARMSSNDVLELSDSKASQGKQERSRRSKSIDRVSVSSKDPLERSESRTSQRSRDSRRRSKSNDRESTSSRDRPDSRASQRSWDRRRRSKSPVNERRRKRSRSSDREVRHRDTYRRERFDEYRRRSRSPRGDRSMRKRSKSRSRSRSLSSEARYSRRSRLQDNDKRMTSDRDAYPSRSQSPSESGKKHKKKKKKDKDKNEGNPKKEVSKERIADEVNAITAVELDSIPIPGEIPVPPPDSPKAKKSEVSRTEAMMKLSAESRDDLDIVEMDISDNEADQEKVKETEKRGKPHVEKAELQQVQKSKKEDKNVSQQIKFSIGMSALNKKVMKPTRASGFLNDDDDENEERNARKRRLPVCSLNDSDDDDIKTSARSEKICIEEHVEIPIKTSTAVTDLTVLTQKSDIEENERQNTSTDQKLERKNIDETPTEKEKQTVFEEEIASEKESGHEEKSTVDTSKRKPPERLKFKYIPLWEMEGEKRPSPKLEELVPAPIQSSLCLDYDSNSSDNEVDKDGNPSPTKKSPEKRLKKNSGNDDYDDSKTLNPLIVDKCDENISHKRENSSGEQQGLENVAKVSESRTQKISDATTESVGNIPVAPSTSTDAYSPSHPSMEDDEDDFVTTTTAMSNTNNKDTGLKESSQSQPSFMTPTTTIITAAEPTTNNVNPMQSIGGLGLGLSLLSHISLPPIVPPPSQNASAPVAIPPSIPSITMSPTCASDSQTQLPSVSKFRVSRFDQTTTPTPSIQVLPVQTTAPTFIPMVVAPAKPIPPPSTIDTNEAMFKESGVKSPVASSLTHQSDNRYEMTKSVKRPKFSSLLDQPNEKTVFQEVGDLGVSTTTTTATSVNLENISKHLPDDNISSQPGNAKKKNQDKPARALSPQPYSHSSSQDVPNILMTLPDLSDIPLPGEVKPPPPPSKKRSTSQVSNETTDRNKTIQRENSSWSDKTATSSPSSSQASIKLVNDPPATVPIPTPNEAFESVYIPSTKSASEPEQSDSVSSLLEAPLSNSSSTHPVEISSSSSSQESLLSSSSSTLGEKKRFLKSPLAIGLLPKLQPQSPLSIGPLPKLVPVQKQASTSFPLRSPIEKMKPKAVATTDLGSTPGQTSSSRIHMVLKNKIPAVSKKVAPGFDDDGSDSEGEKSAPGKTGFLPLTMDDSVNTSVISTLPLPTTDIFGISASQTLTPPNTIVEISLASTTTTISPAVVADNDISSAVTIPLTATYPVQVITSTRDGGGSSSKDRGKRDELDRENGKKDRGDLERNKASGSVSQSSGTKKGMDSDVLEFDLSKVKKEKEDDYEVVSKDKKRAEDGKKDKRKSLSDLDKDKRKSQSDLDKDRDKYDSKRSRDMKGDDRRKRRHDYDDSSGERKRMNRSRDRSRSRSYERERERSRAKRSRERSWERSDRKGSSSINSRSSKRSHHSRDRSRSPSSRRRDSRYERNRSWDRDYDAGSVSGRGTRSRNRSWSRERDRSLSRDSDRDTRRRSRTPDRKSTRESRRSLSRDSDRDLRRRSRSPERKPVKRKSAKEEFLEEVSKIDAAYSSQGKGDNLASYDSPGVSGASNYYSESSVNLVSSASGSMYTDGHNIVYSHEQQQHSAMVGSAQDYSGMAGFEGQGHLPDVSSIPIPGQSYNPYEAQQWPQQQQQQQPQTHGQYTASAQHYPPSMPVDGHALQQQQQYTSQYQHQPPQQVPLHHPPQQHFTPQQQQLQQGQFPPIPTHPPGQQHQQQPPPPAQHYQQHPHNIPLPDSQTYSGMHLNLPLQPVGPPPTTENLDFHNSQHPQIQAAFHQPHEQTLETASHLNTNTYPQIPTSSGDQNSYNFPTVSKSRTKTSTPPIIPKPQPAVTSTSSTSSSLVQVSGQTGQTNDKALPDTGYSYISRIDGKPRKSRFSAPHDTVRTNINLLDTASTTPKPETQHKQMSSTEQSAAAIAASSVDKSDVKVEGPAGSNEDYAKKTKSEADDAAAMESMVSSSGVEDTQADNSEENSSGTESSHLRPLKVKSRWRRNSEAEAVADTQTEDQSSKPENTESAAWSVSEDDVQSGHKDVVKSEDNDQAKQETSEKQEEKMEMGEGDDSKQEQAKEETLESLRKRSDFPKFEIITENIHLTERKRSKSMKRMTCDCTTSREDRANDIPACGSDCLNRMLMIECGSRCPCGDYCTNKRFQRKQYSKTIPLKAHEKGWGLQAMEDMPDGGTFVMEYVGELLGYDEFVRRTKQYSKMGMVHHYFMALNADEVVDATLKGSISRFINHSCDPNCETQKWTVNGELRVGFFTRKPITKGEELTFDYQFEHYGEAQKCYCGTDKCRGYIGLVKSSSKQTVTTSKKKDKKKKAIFQDELLEEDISHLSQLDGMRNKNHVLELCRVMVRVEKVQQRVAILKILQATKEPACLRLFLDYHGLSLFWSWMTDINTADYSDDTEEFKLLMLSVLKALPITNKTILKESKILPVVERWAVAAVAAARKPPPPPPTFTAATTTSSTLSSSSSSTTKPLSESDTASTSSTSASSLSSDVASTSSTLSESENITTTVSEADSVIPEVPPPPPSSSTSSTTPCTSTSPPPTSSSASSSPPPTPIPLPVSNIIPVSILSSAEKSKDGRKKRRVTFAEEHQESQFSPEPPEDADGISSSTPYEEIYGEAAPLKDHILLAEEAEEGQNGNSGAPGEPDSTSQKDTIQEDSAGVSSDTDTSDVEYLTKDPLTSLASELLCSWSGLKEVFKIPKKERVEERKRTERELDVMSKKASAVKDPYAKWKRKNARSSRKRSLDEEDRKTSTPKMSKEEREERRQRFEAQVKAEDQLAAQAAAEEMQRQQEEFMLHQQRLMEDPQYFYFHQQQQEQQQQQQKMSADGEASAPQPVLDPVTGLPMVDPVTGQPILQSAPGQPTQPQTFFDPITGQPLTPQLDPVTGQPVIDPATGQPVFQIQDPVVDPNTGQPVIDPNTVQPFIDPNTGQPLIDPNTGQPLVDPNTGQPLIDPNTGQPLIDPNTGQSLPSTGQPLIDPNTGQPLIDPNTGQPLIDPNTGQTLIDPNTGQPLIDPNTGQPLIDPNTGQPLIDPNTGQPLIDPNTGQPFINPNPVPFHTHPTDPNQPHHHHHPHHHHPATISTTTSGSVPQIDPITGQPVATTVPPQHHHHHQHPHHSHPDPHHHPIDPLTGQPIVHPASSQTSSSSSFIPSQDPTSTSMLPSTGGLEMEEEVPPPPSPPTVPVTKLPPNWKTAKDAEGRVYYYHAFTRQTQWEMPSWDDNLNDSDNEMDLDPIPTEDVIKPSKRKTTTAAADTSSELAKKYKEQFRCKMSSFIVLCLNPFRKSDCKIGRISGTEDFKYLARKLTHHVMSKELKHCRHVEDLEVNENVKAKAKDYVRKYMSKFGSIYRRTGSPQPGDN